VLCQHGTAACAHGRAPVRAASKFVTLADSYDGKKLNSPNDACYHSSGALYFTDPPYGLALQTKDPTRELDFQESIASARTGN